MDNQTRFIAVGDLVANYYYDQSGNLSFIDGGSAKFNTVANLAYLGNDTAVISAAPSGIIGEMLIDGLTTLGVDTSRVILTKDSHRIGHFYPNGNAGYTGKKECPVCKRKTWNDSPNLSLSSVLGRIKSGDIIVLDNLKPEDLDIVLNTPANEKVITISSRRCISRISFSTLSRALIGKFEIIQLNNEVAKELCKRFRAERIEYLFSRLRCKVLSITDVNKTTFLYRSPYGIIYKKQIQPDKYKLVGPCSDGYSELLLALFVDNYYATDNIVNAINLTLDSINQALPKILSSPGARGHLYSPYIPVKKELVCTCEDLSIR